jgi:hypothetical protein
MQRRDFMKQASMAAAAGLIAPQAIADNARSYKSDTISVLLAEGGAPGVTSVYLTEHGDADQAIIEAFYWADVRLFSSESEQRLMRHKEATTTLQKGTTVAADLLMPIADIVFVRVTESKILNQAEFGDVPKHAGT